MYVCSRAKPHTSLAVRVANLTFQEQDAYTWRKALRLVEAFVWLFMGAGGEGGKTLIKRLLRPFLGLIWVPSLSPPQPPQAFVSLAGSRRGVWPVWL